MKECLNPWTLISKIDTLRHESVPNVIAGISFYLYTDWIVFPEKVIGFFSINIPFLMNTWMQHATAPKKENLVSVILHGCQGFVHSF